MIRWTARLRTAIIVIIYTVTWLALDRISVAFETAPEVALFYPPPALDFVLGLVIGVRYLPALLLPRLLDVWFVPPLNLPPISGLAYALLGTIVYGGANILLVRQLRVEPQLRRFRDVFWFVLCATLLAPLLLAILSVTTFAIAGVVRWADWGVRILHFWVGDSTGIASLAPFILVRVVPWIRARLAPLTNSTAQPRLSRGMMLERFAEAIALVFCTWIAFGMELQGSLFLYTCFLPMIWLTVRYGLGAATLAILTINSGAALIVSLREPAPHIGIELANFQFCMLAVSQTALLLGATITRRFQAFLQIQAQARQEQVLNSISRAINSSCNPNQVLQEIVRLTGESFQVDRVVIWQLGEKQIVAVNEWRQDAQVTSILGVHSSISEWFAQRDPDGDSWQHESFQAWDYAALPHSPSRSTLMQQAQICSILRVPIFIQEQFFGNLSLHTTTTHRAFTPEEVYWLEQIAEQAAIALYNAKSLERLQQLVRERTQELEQEKLISESASRAKSEFLANMSHELRTPLTSIQGFSSILSQQIFGPLNDRQQQYVTAIHSSGKHLLELINDILDLSVIEAGRDELMLELVVVEEICQSCLSLLSERALQRGLELQLEIAPHLTTIQADRRRLQQILVNLLANAVKFTAAGSVKLRVSRTGTWIEFAVIDTGIGIAEADRAKLFQPFQQLDSGLNRQYEGTGLGLALSQRLAKLHGGEITLQSQLEHGSCFTLRLPDG